MAETAQQVIAAAPYPLPRVTIKFCTQCKWMLRAAYFAQELLSTFSTALGEVALQPSTGGTFVVEIFHQQQTLPPSSSLEASTLGSSEAAVPPSPTVQSCVLWDRKIDGGFPETKELKRRVRDVIEPGRDLGHVDRHHSVKAVAIDGGGSAGFQTNQTASTAYQVEVGKGEPLPSRSELEAMGQAGAGYPGSGEAAAQLISGLPGHEKDNKRQACVGKQVCKDCD